MPFRRTERPGRFRARWALGAGCLVGALTIGCSFGRGGDPTATAAATPTPDPASRGAAVRVAATARAVAGVDSGAPTPAPASRQNLPSPTAQRQSAATGTAVVAAGQLSVTAPPTATPTRAPATRISTQAPTPTARVAPTREPTHAPTTPTATPALAFTRDKPIVYIAIGASDTVGVGAASPERDGWVPQFYRHLPPGSRLVNLGISGAKLSDALKQVPKAIEARPDLVTVWIVVNDLNANVDLAVYERDLDRMLNDLVSKSSARVLVGNAPDLAQVPAYANLGIPPELLRAEVARWNQAIARVVAKRPGRAYLVDLYARSVEIPIQADLVSADDFHPSSTGYARLADVFWEFSVSHRLFQP